MKKISLCEDIDAAKKYKDLVVIGKGITADNATASIAHSNLAIVELLQQILEELKTEENK